MLYISVDLLVSWPRLSGKSSYKILVSPGIQLQWSAVEGFTVLDAKMSENYVFPSQKNNNEIYNRMDINKLTVIWSQILQKQTFWFMWRVSFKLDSAYSKQLTSSYVFYKKNFTKQMGLVHFENAGFVQLVPLKMESCHRHFNPNWEDFSFSEKFEDMQGFGHFRLHLI